MGVVLLAVVTGFVIGHFNLMPKNNQITSKVMLFGLVFLLVVMGAQLGANEQILKDFAKMGWQAFLLAAGGVLMSVLLVKAAEAFIAKGLQNHSLTEQSNKAGDEQ